MSGFVERVIEDWLTDCDERSYQASFVSLLIRSGHRIRYVSKHTTLEFGKDIVSVSPDGELTAYQLKAGNINLSLWRTIKGEVYELADVPIRSPAGRRLRAHRCYLVTTGTIEDTVREQLRDHNEENRDKGLPEIEIVERHELIGMFLEVFSEFFPVGVGPFNDLVRVYLSNGRGPLDKELFSAVLRAVVPRGETKKRGVGRALSNLVVVAEFCSTPFRLAENHISVIDVWTLVACQVTSLARRFHLRAGQWLPWLELCHDAIEAQGGKLLREVHERPDYVEGDPLVDVIALPYRKTVALGYAAAVINSRRAQGVETGGESRQLLATLTKQVPLGIWGEGSWNYYMNLVLAISGSPEGDLAAVPLLVSWLEKVSLPEGLDPPYLTLGSALSAMTSPDREGEQRGRVKLSYSLGCATDLLCRRMWRRPLAHLWARISKMQLAELVPETTEDQFGWVVEGGTLEVRILPLRGSWRELRAASFEQRSALFSDEDAWLLPYMLCSYPHRVSRKLSGELDYRTASETAQREWAPA